MEIKIDTTITKKISSLLKDESVLKNCFTGNDSNTLPDFVVKNLESKAVIVVQADASAFTLEVFASLSIASDKVSFVHIYCFNSTNDPSELPTPVKFDLSITDGSVTIDMGSMSQYQNANITGLSDTHELIVSNPEVAIGKQVVIVAIVGSI